MFARRRPARPVRDPGEMLRDPADEFVADFVGRDRGFRGTVVHDRSALPLADPTDTVTRGLGERHFSHTDSWRLVVDDQQRPLGWREGLSGLIHGLQSSSFRGGFTVPKTWSTPSGVPWMLPCPRPRDSASRSTATAAWSARSPPTTCWPRIETGARERRRAGRPRAAAVTGFVGPTCTPDRQPATLAAPGCSRCCPLVLGLRASAAAAGLAGRPLPARLGRCHVVNVVRAALHDPVTAGAVRAAAPGPGHAHPGRRSNVLRRADHLHGGAARAHRR